MNYKSKVPQARQNDSVKTQVLGERDAYFNTLFQLNPLPALIFSLSDSTLIDVNPAFLTTLGYSPGEIIGKTSEDLSLFTQPEKHKAIIDALVCDEKIENLSLDVRDKNGHRLSSLFSAGIIHHNGSTAALGILSGVNGHNKLKSRIFEQNQAKPAIIFDENHYRDFLESSPAGIFVYQDQKIILANQAALGIFNTETPSQLVGKTVDNLVRQDDLVMIEKRIEKILAGHLVESPIEVKFKQQNDTLVDAQVVDTLISYQGRPAIQVMLLDASKQKKAQALQHRHQTELNAFNRIVKILQYASLKDEALPTLLSETLLALDMSDGCILLHQPQTNTIQMSVATGWFEKFHDLVIKPGMGISSAVFTSGKTFITDDFSKEPRVYATAIPPGWGGACVPIQSKEKTIGVIFVSCKLPRQITASEVQLLEAIAHIAGISLHRMKLLDYSMSQLEIQDAYHTIDQAIAGLYDLPMTLEIICKQAVKILAADAVNILLYSPHDHSLKYVAGDGFKNTKYQQAQGKLGQGYSGQAALEKQTVQIDNLATVKPPFERMSLLENEAFLSYTAAPLIAKGTLKGVIEIFHCSSFNRDSAWMSHVSSLAFQTAVAIDDLQIYHRLQRNNLELRQAYDTTIASWSQALESHHREPEGHTERVTALTLRLAKAMRVDDEDLVHIQRGALLHNMGKLLVPDSILQKTGPLTEEEQEIYQKHPTNAFTMLSPISYLRPALEIPFCHHEKWDGSGYPRGLKGKQIPLAARIFVVANLWESLRSNRPQGKCWPEEEILAHLRSQSGVHFDPVVVEAFLQMQNTSG